jgi:hypothetical protein
MAARRHELRPTLELTAVDTVTRRMVECRAGCAYSMLQSHVPGTSSRASHLSVPRLPPIVLCKKMLYRTVRDYVSVKRSPHA